MAGNKISALTANTTPAQGDLVAQVDVSDTSQGVGGSTRKVTRRNFLKPIISSETSSATPTINTDAVNMHRITALAANITSMTSGLSGTPTHGQTLIIEFLDNGTGRTIAWGASFRSTNIALPSTTTANKLLRVGVMYDSVDSIWECVAKTEEA